MNLELSTTESEVLEKAIKAFMRMTGAELSEMITTSEMSAAISDLNIAEGLLDRLLTEV